ncbi:MAG TPA: hypothetical protein VG347_03480 [Verrucomicrobiae bacterium]|nr:hypothetical protein [Verrucomicrobiae bacterium]
MQIGKAKALGKDYSELQTQLNKVNSSLKEVSPELTKLGEKEEEASKSAEFLHHNHRQLHTLLRMIPGAAGEASESLLAMSHGPVGPALALAGVFRMLFDALEKIEASQLPDLTAGIDQANQTATAWTGIAKAVESVKEAFSSSEEIHTRALGVINAELKAQKDYIQAVKDRALAELNVQRAGGMDQGEYDRKKGIIENGASDATVQAEIDARNKKLAADKAEADKAAAEAAAAADKAKKAKGPATKEQAEAEAAAYKTVEDAQREKQKAADERVQQIQGLQTDAGTKQSWGQQLWVGFQGFVEMYRASKSENSKFSVTQAGLDANEKTEKAAAEDAKAKADAAAAEQKRIKDAADEKERLEKEAAEKGKRAEELKLKIAPELAPDAANTPGTVAYENAQAAARQRDKDKTGKIDADASAFGADQKKITEDSKWLDSHGPTQQNIGEYKAKIKEMSDALADAMSIVTELAALGADTKKLGTALTALQKDAAETRIIAEHALANSNLL